LFLTEKKVQEEFDNNPDFLMQYSVNAKTAEAA